MKTFPDKYSHIAIQDKWNTFWQEKGVYSFDRNSPRENNFSIDTPPPTVSGMLHMGHIFSYTQTDFIARFKRMSGKNVFYPMGFDDNGLPTERLVEKTKKINAWEIGREGFRQECMDVVNEAEKEFKELFTSIALSVDWSFLYQTISRECITISQMSFLDLLEKGHIYRSLEPTIWDPIDRTALAQADLEDIQVKGIMSQIKFATEDNKDLVISTTRPELLPACVALLYNKNDPRYQHLAKVYATTPIFKQKVPILADDDVEMEKGTGLVMCCTFGDATDVTWWKKYKLPLKVILDSSGKIVVNESDFKGNELARATCEKINNKKASQARLDMLEVLKENDLLISQTEVERMVKCAERSKHPVELLVTPQWFIRVLDKKELLLEKADECKWHPEHMKARIQDWIKGLNWDWCISRQRYFGVPFPVWYSKRAGEEGKVLLATKEQLPADPLTSLPSGYSKEEVDPDFDVMDTWATSSITPQLNTQYISKQFNLRKDLHDKLFPFDLRPQAHEIIRTWAFYTIVKSALHGNSIPWKNLAISGWVLAADKTKMSKSKGNVVTPLGLIQENSADAVRYWASSSKLGADIAYSDAAFAIGKKLINKLWNAAKFSSSFGVLAGGAKVTNSTDKWILSKLHMLVTEATSAFEQFEYCKARDMTEHFFFSDFCDNYLELIKVRAYDTDNKDAGGKASAVFTLQIVLKTLLKLFAPFLPYITEELHSLLFDDAKSVHERGGWPLSKDLLFSKTDHVGGEIVIEILNVVRKFKSDKHLSMKAPLNQISIMKLKEDVAQDALNDLKNVTNVTEVLLEQNSNEKFEMLFTPESGKFSLGIA